MFVVCGLCCNQKSIKPKAVDSVHFVIQGEETKQTSFLTGCCWWWGGGGRKIVTQFKRLPQNRTNCRPSIFRFSKTKCTKATWVVGIINLLTFFFYHLFHKNVILLKSLCLSLITNMSDYVIFHS